MKWLRALVTKAKSWFPERSAGANVNQTVRDGVNSTNQVEIAPLWKNKWIVTVSVVGACAFVLYPELIRDRVETVLVNVFPATDEGLILLETPQVFTRGRLVNDRATEHTWLITQLRRTDDLLKDKAFAAPDFIRFARKNFQLALAPQKQGEPAKENAGDNAAPKDDVRERLAKLGLVAPPLDQLEDAIRYRDTIRNALLSTALDDRHDIDGNTVYRLNFNVSVVPPRGSSRLAAVVAELSEITDQKRRTEGYMEIMHDWRDKIEQDLLRTISDRIYTIQYAGADLPPEYHGDFEAAMLSETVEQIGRFILGKNRGALEPSDKAELEALLKASSADFRRVAIAARATFREAGRDFQRKYLRAVLETIPTLKTHMAKLTSLNDRLDWIVERCNPNALIPLGSLELRPNELQRIEKSFGDQMRCPGKLSVLIPDIDVLDTLVLLNEDAIEIPKQCRKRERVPEILSAVAKRDQALAAAGCQKLSREVWSSQAKNQKERRSDRISSVTARVMAETAAKTSLPGMGAARLGKFF